MTDHVCIRTIDGKPTLAAIETPLNKDKHYAHVEQPISAELLGKYFVYDAEKREYKRSAGSLQKLCRWKQRKGSEISSQSLFGRSEEIQNRACG